MRGDSLIFLWYAGKKSLIFLRFGKKSPSFFVIRVERTGYILYNIKARRKGVYG